MVAIFEHTEDKYGIFIYPRSTFTINQLSCVYQHYFSTLISYHFSLLECLALLFRPLTAGITVVSLSSISFQFVGNHLLPYHFRFAC